MYQITMGGMMMISYVLGQLYGPMGKLIEFSRFVQDASLSNKRRADIYEKPDENYQRIVCLDGRRFVQGIRFGSVSFRYEGSHSKYVLEHIDGEDIRNVNPDSWRARCGVVMQDGFIFSGSVAANIALSEENPALKLLKHAARLAQIEERIEALPMETTRS